MIENHHLKGTYLPINNVVFLKVAYKDNLLIHHINPETIEELKPLVQSKCHDCAAFNVLCKGVSGITSAGTLLTNDNKNILTMGEKCRVVTDGNFTARKDGIVVYDVSVSPPAVSQA